MSVSSVTGLEQRVFRVWVPGIPVPQGSKNAIPRHGRIVVVERGRASLGPWRQQIAAAAAAELEQPLAGPVELTLVFHLLRPKSHFRTGSHAGELRDSAPDYVSTRPDVDKLARAALDALTGVAFTDDGQVAELVARKLFAVSAGLDLTLTELR